MPAALADLFHALGDEVRLRIVGLLAHGELCVCHIESALGLTQSNASRHLGILREAGVVVSRRSDRWVNYRLAEQNDRARARHLDALVATFVEDAALAREVKRLVKTMGPGACK